MYIRDWLYEQNIGDELFYGFVENWEKLIKVNIFKEKLGIWLNKRL